MRLDLMQTATVKPQHPEFYSKHKLTAPRWHPIGESSYHTNDLKIGCCSPPKSSALCWVAAAFLPQGLLTNDRQEIHFRRIPLNDSQSIVLFSRSRCRDEFCTRHTSLSWTWSRGRTGNTLFHFLEARFWISSDYRPLPIHPPIEIGLHARRAPQTSAC